ncbi:hypothetical protein AKJ08_3348 [Vulgatibacter incomptus]|uniref:Uncharacterized protein n=1 Tax=Vulgatibacter incomptus TaxID=1391653 RepID=A0A0K1PHT3_9BACT|nr:hypothetical protein AKJ08_3348 [Vulgatibacter incomptus]
MKTVVAVALALLAAVAGWLRGRAQRTNADRLEALELARQSMNRRAAVEREREVRDAGIRLESNKRKTRDAVDRANERASRLGWRPGAGSGGGTGAGGGDGAG